MTAKRPEAYDAAIKEMPLTKEGWPEPPDPKGQSMTAEWEMVTVEPTRDECVHLTDRQARELAEKLLPSLSAAPEAPAPEPSPDAIAAAREEGKRQGWNEAVNAAATLVAERSWTYGIAGRVLAPRTKGDTYGLEYCAAILSLLKEEGR